MVDLESLVELKYFCVLPLIDEILLFMACNARFRDLKASGQQKSGGSLAPYYFPNKMDNLLLSSIVKPITYSFIL